MEISLFDWLRWIEVPVWLGIMGCLAAHIRHDHMVEIKITKSLAKLDELDDVKDTMKLVLEKLIPERSSI